MSSPWSLVDVDPTRHDGDGLRVGGYVFVMQAAHSAAPSLAMYLSKLSRQGHTLPCNSASVFIGLVQ